jgi:hypothetical protein
MLTDDQLAESIGLRLHAEVADIQPSADLWTTLRRRQVRRTWATRGAVASSLAATAGIVALLLAGAGPPASPRLETVAYVTQQTINALGHVDQYVQKSVSVMNGGVTVTWSDAATNRTRFSTTVNGVPGLDVAKFPGPSGVPRELWVDHGTRSWWEESLANIVPLQPGPGTRYMDSADPGAIRDAIVAGDLRVLGHERLDGRDTLHLRLDPPARNAGESYLDVWVDASSYLPARLVLFPSSGISRLTDTISWLPRTAGNLANLDFAPPAGYTHLPDRG